MQRRHVTTGLTLAVLVGILVAGVVVGLDRLFAPVPGIDSVLEPSPDCTTSTVRKGDRVRARQVQVSVFNGGDRAGLAEETLRLLSQRGFREGDVGNAPEGTDVAAVQIWSTQRNDPAALLVARQFGRDSYRLVERDLGPGVDVVVGSDFRRLRRAPTVIRAGRPSSTCLPATTPAPGG